MPSVFRRPVAHRPCSHRSGEARHIGQPAVASWGRLLVVFGSLTLAAGTALAGSGWQRVKETDGVVVSTRPQPGKQLPEFRGRVTLDGEVLHILGIITDTSRACEWAADCKESRDLKVMGPGDVVLYGRNGAPWPIADRDTVMRRRTRVLKPGAEYRVEYASHADLVPEVDDVVRIRDARVHFHLRRVDAQRTWVEYQLDLDPGGSIPKWVVRWASRGIPIDTLRSIQGQVRRTRGQYRDFVREWSVR